MNFHHFILSSLIIAFHFIPCRAQEDTGFIPLFDGSNLDAWIVGEKGGFEIINGELVTGSHDQGDNLFTKAWYCNYVLRLEFLLSEVGNSGVLIRCDPRAAWETGAEVQLLAPWTPWRDDLHCTGSLYGHVAVTNRPDETTGKWHTMEIRCDRNTVAISVDDKLATLARTDTVSTMEGKLLCGAIGLQVNHASKAGQYAKFRNIYIRDLDLDPAYVSKGFYETDSVLRREAYDAALSLGAGMIEPLATIMTGEDPLAKSGSKQILFDIVARATAPRCEKKYKDDVAAALEKSAGIATSDFTRNYLEWLSGMINYR